MVCRQLQRTALSSWFLFHSIQIQEYLNFFYGLKTQILLVKDNRGIFKLKYPRVLSFGYKVKVFSFAGFFTEFIGKGKANTVSQILVENGFMIRR